MAAAAARPAASRPGKSGKQAAAASGQGMPASSKSSKRSSSDRLLKPEKRAEPEPSDDEVPFDVPDLDEIYRRIDARERGAETSESEQPGADPDVQKTPAHETPSLPDGLPETADRKSTRLNSSHVAIS